DFQQGEDGTMGYLNRMGFFDHLVPAVEVLPFRPSYSGAGLHRGGNSMLVQIARINKNDRDPDLRALRIRMAIQKSEYQRILAQRSSVRILRQKVASPRCQST